MSEKITLILTHDDEHIHFNVNDESINLEFELKNIHLETYNDYNINQICVKIKKGSDLYDQFVGLIGLDNIV